MKRNDFIQENYTKQKARKQHRREKTARFDKIDLEKSQKTREFRIGIKILYTNGRKREGDQILAANYLQGADWHKNPDIIKYIITFYSKSKAFDRLANFYDECAGVEIDEYRDYEKALSALKDASKYAAKSTTPEKEAKIQQLQQKMFFLEKFLQSKQVLSSNPQEMIKICTQLIENVRKY